MPVTSTITDANDSPWGAAPILNLNFNETETIITALWKQDKTNNVFCEVVFVPLLTRTRQFQRKT